MAENVVALQDLSSLEMQRAADEALLARVADTDFRLTEDLYQVRIADGSLNDDDRSAIAAQFKADLEATGNANPQSYVALTAEEVDYLTENYTYVAGEGYDANEGITVLERSSALPGAETVLLTDSFDLVEGEISSDLWRNPRQILSGSTDGRDGPINPERREGQLNRVLDAAESRNGALTTIHPVGQSQGGRDAEYFAIVIDRTGRAVVERVSTVNSINFVHVDPVTGEPAPHTLADRVIRYDSRYGFAGQDTDLVTLLGRDFEGPGNEGTRVIIPPTGAQLAERAQSLLMLGGALAAGGPLNAYLLFRLLSPVVNTVFEHQPRQMSRSISAVISGLGGSAIDPGLQTAIDADQRYVAEAQALDQVVMGWAADALNGQGTGETLYCTCDYGVWTHSAC